MHDTSFETEDELIARAKDAIVSQALAPSIKVTELSLANELQTTRTMSKSVIERLVSEKFLVSISPRVTRVAPLTIMSIRENFLLRRLLMPELVAMSLPHLQSDEIDAHYDNVQAITVDRDDHKAILDLLKQNRAHNLFYIAKVKYPTLVGWVNILEDIAMRIYWLYVRDSGTLPTHSRTQLKLVESMKAGDGALAQATVLEMLQQTEEIILSTLFANDHYFSNDLLT